MQNLKLKFKINIIYKTFYFLLVFLAFEFLFLNLRPAQALTMSNNNFIIKMQGFSAVSSTTEDENDNPKSTAGDLDLGASEGVNFKAKAGFENLTTTPPFSISLSSDVVDFGILSPTNPIIRTVDLYIYNATVYGYSALVFEDKPLTSATSSGKIFIPDTTCDNGNCGTENADEWANSLTYGFGYRCDNLTGTDCDSSFFKPNYFKRFPDILNNDDLQSIMSGVGSTDKKARISYKVNVSQAQSQDIYNNIITYIAIPNF
jgi:hypothetical protein